MLVEAHVDLGPGARVSRTLIWPPIPAEPNLLTWASSCWIFAAQLGSVARPR